MAVFSDWRFFREIKRRPQNFYIVHYSCQSLYDDNDGLSPRITSIAVNHYASQQVVSFSTHAIAEELSIERDDVEARFDEVEKELLKRFYDFVRDRRAMYWVHWNMRNLTYGFEHLEHRYRALGGSDAAVIPVEQRINLNDKLAERYGQNYVSDPKMQSLMQKNGGLHRHFLNGKEEVEAFRNKEYIKLHNSTLCKVGFFHSAIDLVQRGKLAIESVGWGIALDRLFESRSAKAVGLLATAITILVGLYQTYLWVFD